MINFDPVENKLFTDTRCVGISHREGLILKLLIQRAPDVIEKKTIIAHAWGNVCVGDTSLAKSISALRQSFLKLGIKESPIITAPRIGYRILPDRIECVETQKQETLSPPSPASPVQEQTAEPRPLGDLDTAKERIKTLLLNHGTSHVLTAFNALSITLIMVALVILSYKFNVTHWQPYYSDGDITQQRVGELILLKSSSARLSLPLRALLASNQCDCIVFVGMGDDENDLAWFHRRAQDAINLTYRTSQFPVAAAQIAQFVEERK
ncbi:winged helix-turn-helix domain-containing protein [Enterovibrio norvegicus]|uniref:winged helix-turn-helix domain-containing protein n=1 Tax=Enterovibrio norvegicus TaxID=188144 RepID=UPI0013D70E88|nr:winged helix-turn-helix domain-containing protein [Enterovibrio norvegicus]